MARAPKKRPQGDGEPGAVADSAGRLIVTYADGTWSDNLAISRYNLEPAQGELLLAIQVSPRERPGKVRAARAALKELVAKLDRVHTLQVGKPLLRKRVRDQVCLLEQARMAVSLTAAGRTAVYPASPSFGPDAITLNLG